MAVLSTGQSFSSGDQVTAQKLNDIIGQATFTSAADTTDNRSEEHTSELQSQSTISYAVFCLKKKKNTTTHY